VRLYCDPAAVLPARESRFTHTSTCPMLLSHMPVNSLCCSADLELSNQNGAHDQSGIHAFGNVTNTYA